MGTEKSNEQVFVESEAFSSLIPDQLATSKWFLIGNDEMYGKVNSGSKFESKKYSISDLIDIPLLQQFMTSYYNVTQISFAFLDLDNNSLSGLGWQDICTKFHRVCPKSAQRCVQSGSYISNHLHETRYLGYKCLNGLMDYATPIIIEGQHLATIFTGQLLHEPPDEEFFRRQAQEFGFNEEAYMKALKQVPIIPEDKIKTSMEFYSILGQYLTMTGLKRKHELEAADQILRESEQRLRYVLDGSNDGFWDWNLRDEFFFSSRVTDLFGYSREEFNSYIPKRKELVHPDDRSALKKALNAHLEGQTPKYESEYRVLTKSGEWKWILDRGKIVARDEHGKPLRIAGTVSDINQRKLTEKALHDSEEKHRIVFETTGSATIIIEEDTTISLANVEFEKLFGYSRKEIENKKHFEEFIEKDDLKRMGRYHRLRSIDSESVPKSYEFKAIDRQGNIKDMLVTVALITGTKKRVASLVDITDRKRAELELQEKTKLLQEALDNMEKQHEKLKSTQSKLVQSEKMAALGTMVAGVAHEINNPTNYLYLSSMTLEKDLDNFKKAVMEIMAGNDQEIVHYFVDNFARFQRSLTNILEGSNRIKSIVQDLRTFSRLDEGAKNEVSLAELLELTVRLVKTQYKEVEFDIDFMTDRNIECYSAQLNQVFLNIILNSCQATLIKQIDSEDNGMGRVRIRLRDNGQELVTTIEDNGCGMTEEVKARIFEPFFTTKPVGQGTGLGMSISYGIIEKHNGKIEIKSQFGKGTYITISLPYR